MSTTLSNMNTAVGVSAPATLSVGLSPDLMLSETGNIHSVPQRVRIVHSMPGRQEAMVIESKGQAGQVCERHRFLVYCIYLTV